MLEQILFAMKILMIFNKNIVQFQMWSNRTFSNNQCLNPLKIVIYRRRYKILHYFVDALWKSINLNETALVVHFKNFIEVSRCRHTLSAIKMFISWCWTS